MSIFWLSFAILTRGLIVVQFKQRLTISATFDAVLGELSFRDGPYSTDRQVGYEMQGAVTSLAISSPHIV